MKTSPLNNIKIASPCSANWEAMVGDDKKRFCGECKLNVYNLSGMNKTEAEDLLLNSEGRVCVRFYQRSDGTVLTQDCPVGWAKVKRKISRAATAVISLIIGLFAGLFAFNYMRKTNTHTMGDVSPVNTKVKIEEDTDSCPPVTMGKPAPPVMMGTPVPIREIKGEVAVEKAPVKIKQNRQR